MSTHSRPERVGQEIQAAHRRDLPRGTLRDPRIGYITLTGVKVSPDLRVAQVFYSMIGDRGAAQGDQEGLEAAKGFVRREVTRAVKLRVSPEIFFAFDESLGEGDKIDRLLREVKEQGGLVATRAEAVHGRRPGHRQARGPTSFDVVRQVRAPAARSRRSGHTGTLDPMATGVLPICLGEATKVAGFITEGDKAYDAVVRLGVGDGHPGRRGQGASRRRPVPPLTARAAGGGAGALPRHASSRRRPCTRR